MTSNAPARLPPGQRLRAAMDQACIPAPGAFNGLCARAIAQAGFPACYVSGAATSVSAGVPDVGLLGLEHFCRIIREVADSSGLPVLADADTGFGEAEMVRRTVIEYARAGAAGLHIEDQVFPKRCGHLEGKSLVPVDHMCEKVAWAAKAARDIGDGFIICARTDARGVEGLDAAISRAKAYVHAGADMIFPEGLTSEEEFADFARALGAHPKSPLPEGGGWGRATVGATPPQSPLPEGGGWEGGGATGGTTRPATAGTRTHSSLRGSATGGATRPLAAAVPAGAPPAPYLLANMTEFGKTPIIPLARFADMGYSIVIYPVSMLRIAMAAVTQALQVLHREGSVDSLLPQMQTRQDLYNLIGYTPGVAWEYPVR